ncbi:unnamed protein product [Hymenolepis diminuta]|uniref:BAT2 N-terminal domain-containing protein n=1 Tax=Hymenolepis diminuta TaxID=6216 RepID=A0A564YT80_HYMDI|nr:unnamed protein product [Hymenolepis diminuta]
MNTKFSRPDKPKGKFAQSNINLLYKGNASEIQSKPTIRSSGYQVVGKLQGTRRNPPPPPWVPSIKAEMGGQDTKVNIVPPGGSGWGTGPSTANNESSSSPSKNDSKEKQNEASSSILKDITENPSQNNAEDSKSSADDSETPLVKPPQKPFFELRSKTAVVGSPLDLSTDVRPLSGKTLAPMVPFYQRPFASASNTMKDVDAVTDSSIEESKEESQSPTPASKPVSATARSSGWAAVASEEPDFQERITFSDDEDDVVSEDNVEEPARKLPAESSNEHPSPIKPLSSSASVSETPWVTPSSLTTSQVTFPRAAWDQPHSSFSSVSPMPLQSSYPMGSYCPLPRSDGLFPEDMLATTRGTDAALLSEQLQRASFTNASEAQVQAQREERTLAYKSAVNRAQMARKKRSDEQQSVPLEPTSKRNDRSMDSVKSGLTDVNVFPPSFMHSPHGPSPYSTIPPAVNHSAQHSVEPVFAALYSGGLPNMLGNGFVPPPPQAMKPQPHLPSPLSASTWNPHGSFSASNNQPAAFIHPPYPLSNSPKLVPPPTNQGAYFKSDPFTAVYPQPPPPISKSEHPHHHPVDNVVHSFATPIGGETSANHLTGFQPPSKPLQQQQQSNSPILEKRLDSEASGGKDLLNSLSTSLGSHALQISTHTNGTRTTAFTAPPVVDSSYPQTSTAATTTVVPRPQQSSTSHITPLMEVSLSGKWSEKDFEEVFENSSHGAYLKSFKSGRGGGNKHHDDQVRRFGGGFAPNTGRPGGRGGAKRLIRPRPPNPEDEGEEIYEYSRRQQYGAGEHDNTFPRSQQQRSRGNNRGGIVARSSRDYEEDSRQNGADYEREKCKGSGYKSNRHGGESGGVSEKTNSIASAGSGLGRKNFSRSGPSNRRFDGNDGTSKSSTRGNFSANQRKQQPQSEDNAAGDYAASTQNDSEKLDTNATQSDTEQPEGSTTQTYPSQRPHRGGSTGRGRRGAHSGSQRQGASQRRDHRINQNQPRVNQQNNNNNPRRHPDDDNDNHGTPSNSNNNAATSTTTVTTTSTEHSSTNKGESTGGGSSGSTPNESGGGQQQNHQQQSGTVDSLGTGSNKLRSHAHSDGYGKRPNTIQRGRKPIHSAPNVGKIVPLMSINAEAPPSFVNNPNFLDSPLPSPPPPVQKPSTKNEAKGGEKDAVESNTGEEQSAAGSSTDSSEDGFQEVKSKSARRQQQKAKLQQKTLKSSSSNDDRSSSGKPKSRDAAATTASTKKSRVQGTPKGTSEQQKFSKSSSATSKKSDEKDRQQQTRSANATTTTSPTKSSAENDVTKKALLIGPSKNPPPSAWLKPLQETINEKAAALAAARQQRNTKSASTIKASQPMASVGSSALSVNSTVPITSSSSSYAWSVVVGSRTTVTTSSENAVLTTSTTTSTTKVAIQNSGATTTPVSGESKPSSNRPNIATVSESQSKTTSTAAIGDKKGEDGLPVSATTTVAPSSTSAIVCKVLPQKQPESSAAAAISSVVTVAPSTRPESSTTFSTSNITNNNPVQTQPISNQPLSFRRPPLSDVGDWLGSGKANAPAALFLDSYNPGKKMDNIMSQEMNSIFMQHQHQQQSFRQQQQAMAPPQMMNFGLQDLTLRNHQGSLRDSYFTPFSGGGNNGSQQRSVYTPQQKGGAASWQPASWQPPPPQPQAAHFEPSGLWSSNYSTPPPPPPPASYVGVIGADRPSTNNSVATQQQQSRLQQQQQQSAAAAAAAHAVAFAAASIYGRGGGGGGSGSGQQPYSQPQPGGLYAQSPSQQQTPPPHLSFDPNFAYSNGGLAANSTSMFSHHQSSGGPALLAPHQQRQHQLVNSAGASVRDHPPPPMFINAVSHGTPYPPAAAVLPTPGLHY